MNIDFNVQKYEYSKRDGNLKNEAAGVVKSTKYFPYFYEDGKKIIFKPLSKTKPFSTPYFALSEVIWSTIFNKYFDNTIPIYHLATCDGYTKEVPKYHEIGTAVECVTKEDEELLNIYQYFMKNHDAKVTEEIKDYINYCLCLYDYSFFHDSKFFKTHEDIAREFSKQYLYSVLRADQNFHYENISFITKDEEILRIAPPIDHEFSTMFMYIDKEYEHVALFGEYMTKLLNLDGKSIITKNINKITKLYPDLANSFIESLDKLIEDLNEEEILIDIKNYIQAFNSDDFLVGIKRYKENKEEEASKIESTLVKEIPDSKKASKSITNEILVVSKMLKKTLATDLNML